MIIIASRKVKDYEQYCKDKNLTINSKYSLDKYRIDVLMNQQKMTKKDSFKLIKSITNEYRTVAKNANAGEVQKAKVEKDFDRLHVSSHSTRKQHEKNFKAIVKLAVNEGINVDATIDNLTKEDFEKVKEIMARNWRAKGATDAQIDGRFRNYNDAFKFAKKNLSSEQKEIKDKYINEARNMLLAPANNQKYLVLKEDEVTDNMINRCAKMLRELDKIENNIQTDRNLGNKYAYNDLPSRMKRFIRYMTIHTDKSSMYTVRSRDLHRFAENMVEEGVASSTQQNTLTSVRNISKDFNFKFKDEIPDSNIKLGADQRINAKISNAAEHDEFEKARALAKSEENWGQLLKLNFAGIGMRVEESVTEITVEKLQDALKHGKFHIESGKGDRERYSDLFDARKVKLIEESLDLILEHGVTSGDPFAPGTDFNPKCKSVSGLKQEAEDWMRTRRKHFQNSDRKSRADIRKTHKDENGDVFARNDIVIDSCFLGMHSWRAMYATDAYLYRKEYWTNFREKHGDNALKQEIMNFWKEDLQEKFKVYDEKHAAWLANNKKGRETKKPRGHRIKFDNLEKEVNYFIEQASMKYSSIQVGHNRSSVTKIYICKILEDGSKQYTEISTGETYKAI